MNHASMAVTHTFLYTTHHILLVHGTSQHLIITLWDLGFCFWFFETDSYSVPQAGLELTMYPNGLLICNPPVSASQIYGLQVYTAVQKKITKR